MTEMLDECVHDDTEPWGMNAKWRPTTREQRKVCVLCGQRYHSRVGDTTRCGRCIGAAVKPFVESKIKPSKPTICLFCHQSSEELIYDRCTACLAQWRAQLTPIRYEQPRRQPKETKPTKPLAPCVICGRVLRLHPDGRCQRDYMWWKRHGSDRPADLVPREAVRPCIVCARSLMIFGYDRCKRDYVWWTRHGRTADRPVSEELTG